MMKRLIVNIFTLLGAGLLAMGVFSTNNQPATEPSTAPATLPATAPSTAPVALSSVVIRDTDAKAATSQPVVDGGYVTPAMLPAHWTLQFNFASAIRSVSFTIDGKQPHVEHYLPWVVQGDNNPINLPIGDHTIMYAVDGVALATFHLSVLPAPLIGTNLEGNSYPAGDPVIHPQLLVTAQNLHLQTARFWIEGSWTAKFPANYFHVTKAWQAAGVKVIAVANFQNSEPRCSAPPDAVWTAYWAAFPAAAQTGIYAIDLGNEVNTAAYYTGSPAQLAHLMALAYPILHGKGYIVCAPSVLNSLSWYQQLQKLNAFAFADRIDVHSYAGSAVAVVAMVDQGIALGRSLVPQKPCDASEWGVRMSTSNRPAWAAATAAVYLQLQTRTGWFSAFSFYPTADLLDQATPLDSAYNPNEPFHAAIAAVVATR